MNSTSYDIDLTFDSDDDDDDEVVLNPTAPPVRCSPFSSKGGTNVGLLACSAEVHGQLALSRTLNTFGPPSPPS